MTAADGWPLLRAVRDLSHVGGEVTGMADTLKPAPRQVEAGTSLPDSGCNTQLALLRLVVVHLCDTLPVTTRTHPNHKTHPNCCPLCNVCAGWQQKNNPAGIMCLAIFHPIPPPPPSLLHSYTSKPQAPSHKSMPFLYGENSSDPGSGGILPAPSS